MNILLDIGTLGLTSLRDGIYAEIARGSYERVSELSFGMLSGILSGFAIVLTIATLNLHMKELVGPKLDAVLSKKIVFVFFSIIFIVFIMVQAARIIYINRAANHIEQLQRVIAPYIAESQRVIYISRVAQMYTRQQYIDLLSEFVEIANKNNAKIPTFNIY